MIDILERQNTYWRQRGKINWVKVGDANTNFFHARATVRQRHNLIASLKNDSQIDILDHDGKAAILWNAFKNRMGMSEHTDMHFDLGNIYGTQENRDWFDE